MALGIQTTILLGVRAKGAAKVQDHEYPTKKPKCAQAGRSSNKQDCRPSGLLRNRPEAEKENGGNKKWEDICTDARLKGGQHAWALHPRNMKNLTKIKSRNIPPREIAPRWNAIPTQN